MMKPDLQPKPMPPLPPRVLVETEAYAVLRQVAYFFRQANPTPKLLTDTRAAVSDFIASYGVPTPETAPPLPSQSEQASTHSPQKS